MLGSALLLKCCFTYFLLSQTSLVERGICDFARLSKQSVALGRNLFVTRASNKGGVAISIPLTIPAWVLRPGGTNPDSVGQDSLFVDPVALLAQRNGCQVVQSREVFLKTSLTFSTCHLAADLHGEYSFFSSLSDNLKAVVGVFVTFCRRVTA